MNYNTATKIFISGPSGGGKSFLAKKIARERGLQYVDFDSLINYQNPDSAKNLIKKLPDNNFVCDAIPYGAETTDITDFLTAYQNDDNLCILFCFCTDKEEIKRRCKTKILEGHFECTGYLTLWNIYKYFLNRVNNLDLEIVYFDSFNNEFVNKKTIINRLSFIKDEINKIEIKTAELQKYLDSLDSTSYGKNYQDIEALNLKGTVNSEHTWKHIRYLLNWQNKSVADLSCFHGFFSFKCAQHGAKVTGFDRHDNILTVARKLNDIYEYNVDFKIWDSTLPLPYFDIILCIDSLQYYKNQEKFIKQLNASEILFVINKKYVKEIDLINKHFTIVKSTSTRNQWHKDGAPQNYQIFLCQK